MVKKLQQPQTATDAGLHHLPHLKYGPLLLKGRLIGQVATLDEDVTVLGYSLAVGVYEATTGQLVLTRTDTTTDGTIARRNIAVYNGLPELFEDLPRILPERDHLEVLLVTMSGSGGPQNLDRPLRWEAVRFPIGVNHEEEASESLAGVQG